nr:acyl-CoA thioester hydrolase/BAAT C-terminal domain-containing protein [uncultured Chryseobacterium sp.]
MKCIYLLLMLVISSTVFSQTDLFKHYTIHDSKLKSFQVHLLTSDSTATKPLLVYLDGSGNFPIYYKTKSGKYSTSIPMDLKKYSKNYHIVLISKPGTPFKDSLQISASGKRFYPTNENYTTLYSLDWRAETASKAINFFMKKIPVNKKKIVVIGYSEGSQVAPKVAVVNKKVTHVVCIVGNALNHFYDFLINTRLDVIKDKISAQEGQKIIDSLYTDYEKIYRDPLSTKKTWYGETYLKWSSFTGTIPLENMLKLKIPILYIAAGKDNNQTIIDMDYAKLEFIRQGKKNLTYKVYPNSNHYFQEEEIKEGKSMNIDRIDEVHQFAVDWLNTH